MIGSWIIGICSLVLFLVFQAQGIFAGDSGDVVTAAVIAGVPHPPGYPFYTVMGWLFSHLPIATPSWRVTLLSSLPHAVTISLVYACIYRLTKKNVFASLFGSVVLAVNYLFFLYSTTPEVFALFDMFVVLIFYLLLLWQEKKDMRYLYGMIFVYGLSLSHHHLMLFLAPAVFFFVFRHKALLPARHTLRHFSVGVLCFGLGFVPYLYIPLAARLDPILNWNRAVTWDGFIRLISRADYGTFVSSGSFGQTIRERILAVSAYINFVVTDWTLVGVGLGATGLVVWFRRARIWFFTWIVAVLLIGPAFFFYASFPLANRFTLGTYERFLLPSYLFIAIAVGAGFSRLLEQVHAVVKNRFTGKKTAVIVFLVFVTFMIYPSSIAGVTLWRSWGLPQDRTAENLGRDMLAATKPNSILLLSQDTTLFTTQYVRYGLRVRPDTAVIHASRLAIPDYQIVLKKQFPALQFPQASPARFGAEFVKANTTPTTRVYSNVVLPVDNGWYWVPRGLLYEAMAFDELPSADDMYAAYQRVAADFHNPRAGILSRYPHLMLSDVLDVYATGHIAMGKTLMRAEKWTEARDEFSRAVVLSGDTSLTESLEMLGLVHLYFKDCDKALDAFGKAKERSFIREPEHLRMEAMAYGECLGDDARARELFSEYQKLLDESEQSLETL